MRLHRTKTLPAMTLPNTTSAAVQNLTHSHIYFHYQANSISLESWIKLLTICLAPLVTHVVFGSAEPVLLSQNWPRWHDRVTQFSPISIVWRWYAIATRRIRARSWDRADMAASNAIFWTGSKWDGSEEMMTRSRQFIIKLPRRSHVRLVSASTLVTLVMIAQGVGAVIRMVGVAQEPWWSPGYAFPDIFFPIAILSFSRLPASPWLSGEYCYDFNLADRERRTDFTPVRRFTPAGREIAKPEPTAAQFETFAILDEETPIMPDIGSNPVRSRPPFTLIAPVRIWNAAFILFVFAVCGPGIYLSVTGLGPRPFVLITSSSSFLTSVFYFTLSLCGGCLMVFYIVTGKSSSTVIPCMNSTWYKGLTLLLAVQMLIMFIVTGLETRILNDGTVTTYGLPH